MGKYLILGLLLSTLLASCSEDDVNCPNGSEPSGNQFTFYCNEYDTANGRLVIPQINQGEIAGCFLQFVNTRNGNTFNFSRNDSNINFVEIWLIIPSEYKQLRAIPSGTYKLKNIINDTNEEHVPFDIVDYNKVIVNGSTKDNSTSINPDMLFGTDYEDIIVKVEKEGDDYSIRYTMVYEGKTIRGQYKGPLEVIDRR